ncbi:MAG: Virginiamycin lyase [Planctomycetota bacterium]
MQEFKTQSWAISLDLRSRLCSAFLFTVGLSVLCSFGLLEEALGQDVGDTAPRGRGVQVEKGRASEEPRVANAVFGGGCFWCLEAVFERVWGVESVVSGYSGGALANPSYEQVLTDQTGHAEVVRVQYDPSIVSYEELLRIFFKAHDPTSLNAQGPDFGTRYRSVVFYGSQEELQAVEGLLEEYKKKRTFRGKIVTEVSPLRVFFPAEEYHQDYFAKHPEKPYCQANILPKIGKFERGFKENSKVVKLKSLKAEREKLQRESRSQKGSKEQWVFENIAGTGQAGFEGDGGPAREAQLNNPFGVVRGPDGCIWFCEYTGQRIRRIRKDGVLETVAGNGKTGFEGDGGSALQASFNQPHEIRFDRKGDLYVVDMQNHVVRKIEMSTGIIRTVVGTGKPGYQGDGGPADRAMLRQPHSIQFGPDGSLFICDIGNHVIRRVNMDNGVIETFAGTGRAGPTPDAAPIVGTPLNGPRSIDFDSQGDMWLATREGNQVFRLRMKEGRYEHIAGTGKSGTAGEGGLAKTAELKGPKGIALDGVGNVWLADTESHKVRRIDAKTGVIETIAGTGQEGDGPVVEDGPAGEGAEIRDAKRCRLARLHGIFVDADGSVLIGDSQAHRIRVLRLAE